MTILATWNEIFYDLIYVAVFRVFGTHVKLFISINSLGILLEEHPTGIMFLKFCILFAIVWSTWVETTTCMLLAVTYPDNS